MQAMATCVTTTFAHAGDQILQRVYVPCQVAEDWRWPLCLKEVVPDTPNAPAQVWALASL